MVELREYIRESNAIESVHEESAVDDTVEAWECVSDLDRLSHDVVRQVHQRILGTRQPEIAGEYRDIQVYIDSHRPPPPVVVASEMDKLLSWSPADPLEAVEWHVAFEQIHPFADGNGRTGRLLYLWHCRQLDATPVLWRAEDREGYYDLFESTVDLDGRADVGDG
jgi:Fic family protein